MIVKTDCYWYDKTRGGCKKGLPGTPCDVYGCVCYFPAYESGFKGHQDPPGAEGADGLIYTATLDLIDAVEKYVKQECSRATLLARKDRIKKLLKG